MNSNENEFEDLNEDDDDEDNGLNEFMKQFMKNIPNGNIFQIKLPLNIVAGEKSSAICSIFNGKFLINFIDKIIMDEDNSKILLECVQIANYKGNNKATLLDVYNYLSTTHFLDFILAKEFGMEVWAYEGIDIQMQIVENESGISSGKILIIIESSHCPENIVTLLNSDCISKKYINYNNTIPIYPMIERVLMRKSYYSPILVYDITLGIDSHSNINFNILHYGNFYDFVIKKYINEAIKQFYPIPIQTEEFNKLGEKVLRTSFAVEYESNMFSIRIICMPAYAVDEDIKTVKKYMYAGENIHLIKVEDSNFPDDGFSSLTKYRSFISSASSSDTSQILFLYGMSNDNITEYYDDYHVCEYYGYLFSPRCYMHKYEELYKDKLLRYTGIMVMHSTFKMVNNYWVMNSPKIINASPNGSLQLKVYGFINFNNDAPMSFAEIYDELKPELMQIFNLKEDDLINNEWNNCIVYYGESTFRMLFGCVIRNSQKSIPEKKKKFKLFGR